MYIWMTGQKRSFLRGHALVYDAHHGIDDKSHFAEFFLIIIAKCHREKKERTPNERRNPLSLSLVDTPAIRDIETIQELLVR